jgi:DNA replication protein DnaD
MEESKNSEINETDPHWSKEPSESVSRCHNSISHELENLDKILSEMIYNMENSPEDTILLKLRECLRCISDIIIHASQFINQTQAVERTHPIGFDSLQEGVRTNMTKTLTVTSKLRERNLLQLLPLAKDLTLDLSEIKVLISRTTLRQIENFLERYRFKKSYVRRKVESF